MPTKCKLDAISCKWYKSTCLSLPHWCSVTSRLSHVFSAWFIFIPCAFSACSFKNIQRNFKIIFIQKKNYASRLVASLDNNYIPSWKIVSFGKFSFSSSTALRRENYILNLLFLKLKLQYNIYITLPLYFLFYGMFLRCFGDKVYVSCVKILNISIICILRAIDFKLST